MILNLTWTTIVVTNATLIKIANVDVKRTAEIVVKIVSIVQIANVISVNKIGKIINGTFLRWSDTSIFDTVYEIVE